jgi:hypothetical protein
MISKTLKNTSPDSSTTFAHNPQQTPANGMNAALNPDAITHDYRRIAVA